MIEPHHEGWWARKRLTRIDVAGSGLRGAGVSLQVLLHAFAGLELVWYSSVYGDQGDNVLLVATERATAASLEKLPSHRRSMTGAAADSLDLEEYELSDGVAARLVVRFDGDSYLVERRDFIKYEVYTHDDCFFSIEPLDDALLKRVIHCILRQHSFYLGAPVDWAGVLDPIVGILTRRQAIRLKSDPRRKSLTVSWEPADASFFGRIAGRRAFREIRIDDGIAHLTDAHESTGNRSEDRKS